MAYPNLKTVTPEELDKFYPRGIYCACEKCGATWAEQSIFDHKCGDIETTMIDALCRTVLADRD
jgi:hypothetical protein